MAGTPVVPGGGRQIHACVKLIRRPREVRPGESGQGPEAKGQSEHPGPAANRRVRNRAGCRSEAERTASHLSSMEVPSPPREGVSARLAKAPVTVPFPPEEGTHGGRERLLKCLQQQGQHRGSVS